MREFSGCFVVLFAVAGLLLSLGGGCLSPDQGVCGRSAAIRRSLEKTLGKDCVGITPEDLAKVTEIVIDRGEVVRELKLGDLRGLPNLLTFHAVAVELERLPEGLFADTPRLRSLELESNRIREFPATLVRRLSDLRVLSLSQNEIRELPASLEENRELRTLNLTENQIEELPPRLLAGLSRLEDALFGGNLIRAIPGGFFAGSPALREINLVGNRLTTVSCSIFDDLEDLKWVLLDGNRLKSLDLGSFARPGSHVSLGLIGNLFDDEEKRRIESLLGDRLAYRFSDFTDDL